MTDQNDGAGGTRGDAETRSPGHMLTAISNEMVRLFKEQFGRGPKRARTELAGPNCIVCILEDTFTPAERNLAAMGEHQRLRDTRQFFQYASVAEFVAPVERITGRRVRAFMSGLDPHADGMACEIFVLYPDGVDGPSRADVDRRRQPPDPAPGD
jgi:uncharacterized protein YbcI